MRGRLRSTFAECKQQNRAALVAYLTFGDPDPATSIDVVEAACRSGADIVELGVPFSDPSADGPTIQRAMERALEAGSTLSGALDAVAGLRGRGIATPIVLFGYYNPIFVMGPESFAARAANVGVDAVLTVDLPIDELAELAAPLAAHEVDVVPLVAPTSTPDRIARLNAFAPSFAYYISLTGVTGARAQTPVDPARIAQVRSAVAAPIAVGFGIRTPADAKSVAAIADGVVVGSALVERVGAGDPTGAPARVAGLVSELAAAMVRSSR